MFSNLIINFLSSQLFANVLLLFTVLVALFFGYRQIYLNDVVELYAITSSKSVVNQADNKEYVSAVIKVQNIGTRLVYMDKYVFNGTEYLTQGQVLPSSYSKDNALYWIDLPDPKSGVIHVSVIVYYHDLDFRYWKSDIVADFGLDGTWKVYSLPRVSQ